MSDWWTPAGQNIISEPCQKHTEATSSCPLRPPLLLTITDHTEYVTTVRYSATAAYRRRISGMCCSMTGRSADHPDRMSPARRHAVVYNAINRQDRPHTVLIRTGSAQAQTAYRYQVRANLHNSLTKLPPQRQTRDPTTGRFQGAKCRVKHLHAMLSRSAMFRRT